MAPAPTVELLPLPQAPQGEGEHFSWALKPVDRAPNAVQVTETASYNTFFGALIGKSSVNISKTAVASLGSATTFNVIVLHDMSASFSPNLAQQQAADQAILDCISSSGTSTSTFGITQFNGKSTLYQPLTVVNGTTGGVSNYTTLKNKITALANCGQTGGPTCSGSNAASGIYSIIQQYSGAAYVNSNNHVVIITDGVPNVNTSVTYGQTEGTFVNSTGTGIATTGLCTTKCTNANLLTMANGQAAIAGTAVSGGRAGLIVSTIYYSGSTPTGSQSTYTTLLAGWKKNGGISMVAPTTAQISGSSGGICSLMGYQLKAVGS